MATVDEIETLADACSTALAAGDYATAKLKWTQLSVMIGAKPDVTTPELSTRWDRATLDNLGKQIAALEQSTGRSRRRVLAGFRNRGR